MAIAAKPFRLAFFFFGFAAATLLLALFQVELAYHVFGLAGAGHSAVSRRLQQGHQTHQQSQQMDSDTQMTILLVDFVFRLVVLLVLLVVDILVMLLYWKMYITPTPDRYLRPTTIVPEDMKGKWQFDAFDCCGDIGTCCCATWCPSCLVSDLWYRAGFLHAVTKGMSFNSCVGWQWFAGLFGMILGAQLGGACLPCFFGVLRGGASCVDGGDGGLGEIIPHRKRFSIAHDGWSTFFKDCCLWCWCHPCAATQEYRQVTALLDRSTPEAAAPAAGQIPEAVVGVAVGVPVQESLKH